MKKIRDGPIGAVIHIHTWKYHKETPCVATCISNKLKCHVFCFIFSLFSPKLESRKAEQVLLGEKGLAPVGRERCWRKG
jgi:hypothetical protein